MEHLPQTVQQLLDYYFRKIDAAGVVSISCFCLVGSLGMQAFVQGKSDIDFIAITDGLLSAKDKQLLTELHLDIAQKFTVDFNGFYIPDTLIRNPAAIDKTAFVAFYGKTYEGTQPEMYYTFYYQFQHAAVVVRGTKPIVDIDYNALLAENADYVKRFGTDWLNRHTLPRKMGRELLTTPLVARNGILSIARNLYLLKEGRMIPKAEVWDNLKRDFPAYAGLFDTLAPLSNKDKSAYFSWSRYRQTHNVMKLLMRAFEEGYAAHYKH